jgi:uncharacterized protein
MSNKKINLYPNKIILVAGILLSFIPPTAMARPTGYCPKTPGPVLKTICKRGFIGDGAPLELDYTQSLIYEFSLVSTKNSPALKESQRQWAKKRATCKDVACVTESTSHRIHELAAIIDGHPNKSQSSENKDLKGLWNGGGGASLAIYGNVLITDHVIIWGGSQSGDKTYCKTTYTIEKKPPETIFEDAFGRIYTPNEKSQFKIYNLKLNPRRCTTYRANLILMLRQNLPDYAEFFEYEKNNHISGKLGLHKLFEFHRD